MPLETATYIHQLNSANPSGSDKVKDGDDHIRMIKAALKATFPGITSPLDAAITPAYLVGLAASLVPFGLMAPYAGTVAPAGWAICDGSTVPRSDGTGTVVVPDCRGKVVMGLPIAGTVGQLSGSLTKTVTSSSAGEHTHTGTIANAGSHTHGVTSTSGSSPTGVTLSTTNRAVDGTGSSQALLAATLTDASHSHTVTSTAADAGSHTHEASIAAVAGHGHSVTVDVTQPSIAFNIIIKV